LLNTINEPFELLSLSVLPLPVEHGSLQGCVGYRVGPLAYIPDLKRLTPQAVERLQGVRCLILDCLRETRPHSTHIILPESLSIAREIRPAKCYFTHFCHDIHYRKDAHHLDPWMSFAFDGLKIEVGEDGAVQESIH
jgi:phosphoribosyl 1,2-cyclic phosphate phosphodiesterase